MIARHSTLRWWSPRWVAERAGISWATAQRHLAALATRGLIEVRLRYGSTGRPEHRFTRES